MDRVINWFEIPVVAFARAKRFYETVFQIEMPTRMMGEFNMAFFPNPDVVGGTTGALVCGEGYKPSSSGSRIYLQAGPDFDALLARVEKAGGNIIAGKKDLGENLGSMAIIMDTEGNHVGLHANP